MGNPFYLQELPDDAPFCDRETELRELISYAQAKANLVIYSPRRFGKTSLVRRVQKALAVEGAVTVFVDLFGVGSIEDVAGRLAKSVFAVTRGRDSLWKTALKAIRCFRPILKPDPEGGLALSVETVSRGQTGLTLLDETLESLGEFIRTVPVLVQVSLDEFQEIVLLKEVLKIEGVLRTHIQRHTASYFFIGSRRRILLALFNDRQRPFFQSAINYLLKSLPPEDLARFIQEQFKRGKRSCPPEVASNLASLVRNHPYYAQKLGFFVYELGGTVKEETLQKGLERLLSAEKPVFEAVLQGLSPHQRLLLQALAQEPTPQLMAGAYLRNHGLESVGGVQHSTRQLAGLDLIEKDEESGIWRVVDPMLALWLKGRSEERIEG
jgi:hypothetical protein